MVTVAPSGSPRAVAIGAAWGGLADGIGVALGAGVAVGTSVGAGLGTGVGEAGVVGVGSGWPGTGGDPAFWGSGIGRTAKSAALSSVSTVEPAEPPGSRSMLEPGGGAGAGGPSSHGPLAAPQPTASTAVVAPWMRSATLPPVAAIPPAYSASAIEAKAPASFATSRWAPGATKGAPTSQPARRVTVLPLALT
jgi:hypothetical protein